MRTTRRRSSTRPAAVLGAAMVVLLALVATAAPVAAKEGMEARFDAPIARDTPPGTEILVAMFVSVPVDGVDRPVEGSPIYLKLTGPGGDSTLEIGRQGDKVGHYTVRIEVPKGGITDVEVGIRGTTDLPIHVAGKALVAGGITATTAQVAPAITPPPTLAPAFVAPAVGAAAPVASVPAVQAAPAEAPTPLTTGVLPAVAIAGLVVLALAVIGARRARTAHRVESARRAPGG